MSWNYRVIRMDVTHPEQPVYQLHEVFYDEDGKPYGCSESLVSVEGETVEEIKGDLRNMLADLDRLPVMKESELNALWERMA